MEYTRKQEITPAVEQTQVIATTNTSKKRLPLTNTEKILRIIKIVLKLASVNGYDDEGRVKGANGYISGSSLVVLLNYALSFGQPLIGELEFIRLLKEANVDPDLIVNENLKNKLLNHQVAPEPNIQPVVRTEQPVIEPPSQEEPMKDVRVPKRSWEDDHDYASNKRQRTESDEEQNALDAIGWEVPKKRKYDN